MTDLWLSDLLSRWFALLPADPFGDLLLTLAMLLALVLSLFAIRLPGGWQMLVLAIVLSACMILMVVVDHAAVFYVAWEAAAFIAWAIGRAGADDDPEEGTVWPVTAAGVVASILMILGLWTLSSASGTAALSGMQPQAAPAVSLVLLAAVQLKTLTLFGYAWRERAQRIAWASSAYVVTACAFLIGVYPFARLLPGIYSDVTAYGQWRDVAAAIGFGGLVVCALAALGEDDVKRAISYAALGQLLLVFAALAIPGARSQVAMLLILLVYTFAASALYSAFGMVEAATGERSLSTLSGLGAGMPGAGLVAILATLGLAGMPPVGAFVGHVLLVSTLVQLSAAWPLALYVTGMGLTILFLWRLFRGVFLGRPSHDELAFRSRFSAVGMLLMVGLLIGAAALPFWSKGLFEPIVASLVP